jgi:hypothetical protein
MTRETQQQISVQSALAQLWDMAGLCDETRRMESPKAALAQWLRAGPDCKRWVIVVAAAGRTKDLPPDLLYNRAFFNAHDWRIPNV